MYVSTPRVCPVSEICGMARWYHMGKDNDRATTVIIEDGDVMMLITNGD